MSRLLVLALLLSIMALAVVAVTSAVLPGRRRARAEALLPRRQEDTMPAPFRTIAYTALILLLMGVVTGVLGGA